MVTGVVALGPVLRGGVLPAQALLPKVRETVLAFRQFCTERNQADRSFEEACAFIDLAKAVKELEGLIAEVERHGS